MVTNVLASGVSLLVLRRVQAGRSNSWLATMQGGADKDRDQGKEANTRTQSIVQLPPCPATWVEQVEGPRRRVGLQLAIGSQGIHCRGREGREQANTCPNEARMGPAKNS